MSWAADLQPATFRGIVFDCLVTDDSAQHTLVHHNYPFVAGADIEDMGTGSREMSVSAVFWGDAYEQALENFIAVLEQSGAAEFIHPVFGSVPNVQVARFSVHHEADNVDLAYVDFELFTSTAGATFFNDLTALQTAQGLAQKNYAARSISGNTLNTLMLRLKALNPLNQLALLRQTMLSPLFAMQAIASQVVTSGMDVIAYPASFVNDLSALAGGVANIGSFAPDALLSSYSSAFNRLGAVLTTGSSVVTIEGNSPGQADAVQAVLVHVGIEFAATVADAAAAVFEAEVVRPTLSPSQIETITNSARGQIETAIGLVDATYSAALGWPIIEALKQVALGVQQTAAVVIDAQPPIITRQVITPVPLRLLAFRWYGDHARAAELMRLNLLPNPNFLLASDELICYAK